MRTATVLLLAMWMFVGCATLGTEGELQFAGNTVDITPERFNRNLKFQLPTHFALQPEQVHSLYGRHCRGHYVCDYFADDARYYLVMNWNLGFHLAFSSIPSSASVIVDGKTGALLKAVR
jgi:hypothetical protein